MVLDLKYDDHLVEQYLSKSLHSGSYRLKWVSVSLIKILLTFLD